MDFIKFEQLVKERQSCRSFSKQVVDSELLENIAKAALLAPSADNSQPWSIDVVCGDLAKDVANATQDLGLNKFTTNCFSFIVLNQERSNIIESVGAKIKGSDYVGYDLGIICAHIILAAKSAGLESCVLGWFNKKKISKILNLAKSSKPTLVIAIGYGGDKNTLRPKKRKSFDKTLRVHK